MLECDSESSEQWVPVNQSVTLSVAGQPVKVTVTDVHRNGARLGFDAAESVKIWRKELLDRPKP